MRWGACEVDEVELGVCGKRGMERVLGACRNGYMRTVADVRGE